MHTRTSLHTDLLYSHFVQLGFMGSDTLVAGLFLKPVPPDCRDCVSLASDFPTTKNARKVVLLPE